MSNVIDLTPAFIGDILVYAGDTETFKVSFQTSGVGVDISHLTWTSQIRQTRESNDSFDVELDTTDTINGNIVVTIAGSVTAVLPRQSVWDLQYVPEGNDNVETIMQAKVKCSGDVTRS